MITIRKPLCFSEIGRKDNQEDYLYPSGATDKTRIFILCDGMGGHDNGEVASRTAAEALGKELKGCQAVDAAAFEAALAGAYDALDAIDTGSERKPGTTMTCLCLNDDSYLVAHIGDSRIYHLRPSLYDPSTGRGGIIYQSSDHSLVNDLLKAGELTEEEARDFPRKNVITRAMQPHLEQRYKADVYEFDDIRSGDYFFLCCDGILEQLSNEELCKIIADPKLSDEQKLAAIKAVCDGRTRDNYTCWLIPIDKATVSGQGVKGSGVITPDVEEQKVSSPREIKVVAAHVPAPKPIASAKAPATGNNSGKYIYGGIVGVALAALVMFGVRFFSHDEAPDKADTEGRESPIGKEQPSPNPLPSGEGKRSVQRVLIAPPAAKSKGTEAEGKPVEENKAASAAATHAPASPATSPVATPETLPPPPAAPSDEGQNQQAGKEVPAEAPTAADRVNDALQNTKPDSIKKK